MNIYCKRNKYIKNYSFGRNNKGIITIRGRQRILLKITQSKNTNYNYIFLKYIKDLIKLKIIQKIIDFKLQRFIYKVIILNSPLKNQYKYIPITKKTLVGDVIYIGEKSSIKYGNILPINKVPCGSWVHNIESLPTKGAVFARNSKKSAFLIYLGENYATLKLPSGEIRLLNNSIFCILGELFILPTTTTNKYKAGNNRVLGKRPKVRGVAMNACDHPHGGGEGKHSIGRKTTYSP